MIVRALLPLPPTQVTSEWETAFDALCIPVRVFGLRHRDPVLVPCGKAAAVRDALAQHMRVPASSLHVFLGEGEAGDAVLLTPHDDVRAVVWDRVCSLTHGPGLSSPTGPCTVTAVNVAASVCSCCVLCVACMCVCVCVSLW